MQSVTKQTLKIYWQHTKRYKGYFAFVMFCIVTTTIVDLTYPILFKSFLNLALGDDTDKVDGMIRTIWYLAGLTFIGQASWRAAGYSVNYFQPRVMSDLLNTCYEYLLKHSYGFFNNNFVGSIVTRTRRYQASYEKVTDTFMWNLSRIFLLLVAILCVLFYLKPLLGLLTLTWCVVWIGCTVGYSRWKLKYDLESAVQDTKTTAHLADTMTNNINIKLFTSRNFEVKSFHGITDRLFQLRKRAWDLGNHLQVFQSVAIVALEFTVLYSAVQLWQKGQLTIGDFALLQLYLGQIFHQLWDFGKYLRNMYEALADANEMTEMLMEPHEVVDAVNAKKLKVQAGAIEFRDVDFHYHEETPILKVFNLQINSGERIALIGPSGGGKSTITKLLFRFKDIQGGQVLIDGQDISMVTQESLRKQISLVPQEPILFHRTLLDNIRYGEPTATEAEVIDAAKAAHAHEFISQFPEKYKTYVGERGVKLSGGERQRVAIARAILKNAPILVLDEATSSLDSESEAFIQDALKTLMKGKTTIVVAHRLSTIMKMDRIIVIEDGRITEQGKHAELLKARQGTYQKLWEIQAGGFVTA